MYLLLLIIMPLRDFSLIYCIQRIVITHYTKNARAPQACNRRINKITVNLNLKKA